jgi:uncharacterized RDD family membrane protein YckC
VLEQGARIFKVDLKKMDELLGGTPRSIKGNLDEETARRYEKAILQAGMVCHVEVEAPANDSLTVLSKDDTSTGFSCPKCGYCAAGAEGKDTFEECPRCGIVVEKYLSRQAAISAAVPQDDPISPPTEDEYEPASIVQRRHAAAGSFFVPNTGIHLIGLVAAVLFYLTHYQVLSNPMPGTVEAASELAGIRHLFKTIFTLSAIVIWLAYFVYFPSRNGGTWAQRHMNIRVVSMNPEREPGIFDWFLRAAVIFVCMVTIGLLCPLVLFRKDWLLRAAAIFGCIATVGLLSLLPLFRKDRRSLADLVSGTRQVKRGAPEGNDSSFVSIVTILAVVVSFGSAFSTQMLLTPPRKADQKPVERKTADPAVYAQQNRQVLKQISSWEELHLKEYGSYTVDAMKLFAKYANMHSSHTLSIHQAITDNRLRLELTDSGFRAMMPVYGVPNAYQVYTEKGDQGVQAMVLPKVK